MVETEKSLAENEVYQDIMQGQTQKIIDVGEAFLQQSSESSIEYEQPEIQASTGFMDKVNALRAQRAGQQQKPEQEQQAPANPELTVEEKAELVEKEIVDAFMGIGAQQNHFSSDIDDEAQESEFVGETTEVDTETDAKATDIEIVHSTIVQSTEPAIEYISFEDEGDDARPNVADVEDNRYKPRSKLDWKKDLTRRDLDSYHQAIVDDLVMIEDAPVWFGASDRQKSREDGEWYRGRTMTEILDKEIADFVEFIKPSHKDEVVRKFVVRNIADVVYKLWPFAKVYVFGSFQTKMYLPSGDMDIVIIMPGEYTQGSRKMANHQKLANALNKRRMAKGLQLIEARVPLVKYVDVFSNLKIDISFNVDSGVQSSRIISDFMWKHPALYPLSLIVKQFLVIRDLNEVFSGGLGSYGLSAMITSFLLMHPRIRSGQIGEADNVGVLLLEFFEFYGKRFNYDRVGISLRHGGRYFIKGRLGNLSNTRLGSLTIEDPQDVDNDITKGSFNMYTVVSAMSHAFDSLTTALFEHLNRQAQYSDIKIRSLLSTIVYLEPEALKQRERLHGLYDKLPEDVKSDASAFVDGLVPSNLTSSSFNPYSPNGSPTSSPVVNQLRSSPKSGPNSPPTIKLPNANKPSASNKRKIERLDSSEDELLTKRQRKAKQTGQTPLKRSNNNKKNNSKKKKK